jgi:hypothetical protein
MLQGACNSFEFSNPDSYMPNAFSLCFALRYKRDRMILILPQTETAIGRYPVGQLFRLVVLVRVDCCLCLSFASWLCRFDRTNMETKSGNSK